MILPEKPYCSNVFYFLAAYMEYKKEAQRWNEKALDYHYELKSGGKIAADLCHQFARASAKNARWAWKEFKEAL